MCLVGSTKLVKPQINGLFGVRWSEHVKLGEGTTQRVCEGNSDCFSLCYSKFGPLAF